MWILLHKTNKKYETGGKENEDSPLHLISPRVRNGIVMLKIPPVRRVTPPGIIRYSIPVNRRILHGITCHEKGVDLGNPHGKPHGGHETQSVRDESQTGVVKWTKNFVITTENVEELIEMEVVYDKPCLPNLLKDCNQTKNKMTHVQLGLKDIRSPHKSCRIPTRDITSIWLKNDRKSFKRLLGSVKGRQERHVEDDWLNDDDRNATSGAQCLRETDGFYMPEHIKRDKYQRLQ